MASPLGVSVTWSIPGVPEGTATLGRRLSTIADARSFAPAEAHSNNGADPKRHLLWKALYWPFAPE
jgi:hypothetical protein